MTPERIEREREAFERFLFKKFELDYDDLEMRDVYFRRRKNGEYLNDTFTEKFDIWLARAAQSEWISVEDRLPEYKNDSEQFLIMCQWKREPKTYFYKTSRLLKMLDHIYFDSEPCGAAVIYWQPFPAPPTTNPAA
ncbi:DUF551 domain-containing protein [Eikenella corrodens]|uniref:DUF551 domain-containing protein n=1 Tax=Eikenella corrodens TaxID=539 RepID=UPI0028E2FBDA|nr:DUF551 domain-containing protein [Eikenella corrodens]